MDWRMSLTYSSITNVPQVFNWIKVGASSLWLILLLSLLTTARAYRHFQDEIPNGDEVYHPCKPNFIWRGVGHRNVLGGGKLNPFGEDFKQAKKKWTKELCQKDSDGDGLTNGQELGDPDCTWRVGQFPARTKNITHPGVCDPWGDAKCKTKNIWVSCDAGEFKCDAIKDPGVKNITLRYPPTNVPPVITTYMCMTFDLPQEDDYHIIATMPLINNSNVMHHIVLYGCRDDVVTSTKPNRCYMSQAGCQEILAIWTLGMTGDCFYKDAGFHIGKTGTKKAALQFHWTNPELVKDYVDSSGLTLFYTANRRKYDAGVFVTGNTWLEIPPGKARAAETSTCTSQCTNSILMGPVYITSALNHMHYLGFEQNVELYRDGNKVTDLAYDPVYSYDTPIVHVYHDPIEIRPGDHLKTTCVFRSLSKKQTTYYGEGSYDEMCYGIFQVYPRQNIAGSCTTWRNVSLCNFPTVYSECMADKADIINMCNFEDNFNDCLVRAVFNLSNPDMKEIHRKVMENCNSYGSCRPECPAALDEVRKHPCLHGDLSEYILYHMSQSQNVELAKFAHAAASCDRLPPPLPDRPTPNNGDNVAMSLWAAICSAVMVFLAK
ncbi:uncharacterized protein LOC121382863 [Gigantopelta aegis]|uniref:uncharacterized protein LOC121382863 n=1 Tax=Gigantopelta aegis TaxID=1735272 RepID=UPI001B887D0A|nr:uncharacterized protein LOC121382863 [Gigantopelta aegis]